MESATAIGAGNALNQKNRKSGKIRSGNQAQPDLRKIQLLPAKDSN
jgi:hypothetical protein